MMYYRCKCGNREAWGSMPPYPCTECEKCGSDLATDPGLHTEPKPHDFSDIEKVQTDQGAATITRCRYCHRTIEQVHKEDPPPKPTSSYVRYRPLWMTGKEP